MRARSPAGNRARTACPARSITRNRRGLDNKSTRPCAACALAATVARARPRVPVQVDQPPVLDAGRAGSLARAAGEAPIEVVAGGFAGRAALDELLDQVDASARTVELVARDAIGGAGRQAEPAMDAVAEQRLRFVAACGSFEFAGGAGVHGYRSA